MLWTSRTTVHDLRAIAETHAASMQHAHLGIFPDTFLFCSSIDDRAMQWIRMLADPTPRSSYEILKRDGRIIGCAAWGPCQDAASEREDTGEIYGVYLRRDEWGKGIDSKLVDNALKGLRKNGFSEVRLWVPEQSQYMRHLYECFRFELTGTTRSVADQGAMITLVRYWRGL